MTKGIQAKEPDPRVIYADIIDLPHHQSADRKHMSLYDRAAQFAPYAALVGYDTMIHEEARFVDQQMELTDEVIEKLNRKLSLLAERLAKGEMPEVVITYFEPDLFKAGGSYRTVCEKVRRIDRLHQKLILERIEGRAGTNASIDLSRISEIHEAQLDAMDDEIL